MGADSLFAKDNFFSAVPPALGGFFSWLYEEKNQKKYTSQTHSYSRRSHLCDVFQSGLFLTDSEATPEMRHHRYRFVSSLGNTSLPTAKERGTLMAGIVR